MADEFAGAGVGVVGFEDHGAAGGEGGGGVTTRRREGEREVAGTEDGDGAQRDLALADVRPGCGGAVREGGVDADAAVVALADHCGEEPELGGGAGAFAGEAGGGEAGFLGGAGDEVFADGFDVLRDRFEEGGVGFGVQGAEGGVGVSGGGGRGGSWSSVSSGIRGIELLIRGGIETESGFAVADDRPAGDQGMSGECHGIYS